MISMYIGSGEVNSLLAGYNTKAYAKLLQRFVSDEKPYFNAKLSPIDPLRTGAILEDRYALILPDDYYPQVRVVCEDMDVLTSTIDFAKISDGKVVDFEEMKTCSMNDFLEIEPYRGEDGTEFVRKKYKRYYNQVQHQMLCAGLDECSVVFVVVYSYDDEVNQVRDIKENEIIKFRIKRDGETVKRILERAKIFQQIKNHML